MGVCAYALVKGKAPEMNEEDGCISGMFEPCYETRHSVGDEQNLYQIGDRIMTGDEIVNAIAEQDDGISCSI